MRAAAGHPERGAALMEFALVLPFMLMLLVASIDFGRLIQTRLILATVSREGGSIASRTPSLSSDLTKMVVAIEHAARSRRADGRVYTHGHGGDEPGRAKPKISTQIVAGLLPSRAASPSSSSTLASRPGYTTGWCSGRPTPQRTSERSRWSTVISKVSPAHALPGFMEDADADNGGFAVLQRRSYESHEEVDRDEATAQRRNRHDPDRLHTVPDAAAGVRGAWPTRVGGGTWSATSCRRA